MSEFWLIIGLDQGLADMLVDRKGLHILSTFLFSCLKSSKINSITVTWTTHNNIHFGVLGFWRLTECCILGFWTLIICESVSDEKRVVSCYYWKIESYKTRYIKGVHVKSKKENVKLKNSRCFLSQKQSRNYSEVKCFQKGIYFFSLFIRL